MTLGAGRSDRVALGAALVCFVLIAVTLELTAEEDAFIYYRYAWHWAHGQGLAFNPGDPVEGFSSPLWMGGLALVAWTGLDLPSTGPALGIASGAATLAATWWLGGMIGLSRSGRRTSLAALAVSSPFIVWSRSGLETPFYSLAIVVAVAAYVGAEYPPRAAVAAWRWLGALALIVVCLGRPEGPLLAMVIVGDRLLDGRDWRGALRYVLPAVTAYGAYLVWRTHTFNSLVPNTTVKLYAPLVDRASGQALEYVVYLGVLPLALPLLALWHRARLARAERRRLGVLLSAVLLSFVFHFIAGGDYRPGFRFLVPTLPLVLVAIWYAFEVLGRRLDGSAAVLSSPLARACLLLFVLAGPATLLIQSPPRIMDWRQRVFLSWRDPFSETWHWGVQIARWIDAHVPPNSVVAFGQMGRIPYFAARHGHDVRFIDTLGLVDREVSQIYRVDAKLLALWRDVWNGRSPAQALEAGRLERAHRAATSILARRPDFILVETSLNDNRVKAILASPDFTTCYREIRASDRGVLPHVRVYFRDCGRAPRGSARVRPRSRERRRPSGGRTQVGS